MSQLENQQEIIAFKYKTHAGESYSHLYHVSFILYLDIKEYV